MQIGDTLTISSIELPEGSKPIIDRDFVIANISAPSALASQLGSDEDGEDGGAADDEA